MLTHNFHVAEVQLDGSLMNYADDKHDLLELCLCQSLYRKWNSLQMVQMKRNTRSDHLQRGSLGSGGKQGMRNYPEASNRGKLRRPLGLRQPGKKDGTAQGPGQWRRPPMELDWCRCPEEEEELYPESSLLHVPISCQHFPLVEPNQTPSGERASVIQGTGQSRGKG